MKQFGIVLMMLVSVCATASDFPPLETVGKLDLNRYLGKWYEVAAIPQSFQKGCVASTANYSLRDDGKIDVLNECRLDSLDGKLKSAHGKAWVVNPEDTSKLKVQFFWPFSGAYWVIELGENYEYAVIGHPNRKYLWILSRTPQVDQQLIDGVFERLKDKAYDVSRIKLTLQPSAQASE